MKRICLCLLLLLSLTACTHDDPMGEYASMVEETKEQISQYMMDFQEILEEAEAKRNEVLK